MKVPLLCQVASLLLLIAVDGADNIQFDPDDDNTVKCTIAPYTDVDNYFKPKVDQCLGISYSGTSSGLDLNSVQHSSIHRLAVAYAPVLFFHPLEKYSLSSVDATFARPTRGNLYQNSGGVHLIEDQLNLNTFLKTSRDPVWALQSSSFFFTLEDYAREMYFSEPDEKFGDGYDEEGKSKAKIYYNVFESGNGTWTFNYWLYYEFNGEGNMGIVSTPIGDKTRYTRFHLKPYGIHEGDWEAISVIVCPPFNVFDIENDNVPEPLAIHFRQHSWGQLTDCTQGECKFYKDTYHPVGFAALNSHATYVDSADELVYVNIDVGFFFNLQAFLVVDRTKYKKSDGSYNYFMPEFTNLERLQPPEALTLEAADFEPCFWQAFGGNWGSQKKISADAAPPVCLGKDQLEFVECPTAEEDPIFDIVMQMMGVREATKKALQYIQRVSNKVVEAVAETSVSPKGPVTKHYYEAWVEPKLAPFWNTETNTSMTGEEYCARIVDVPNVTQYGIDEQRVNALDQIYALVATVAALTFLNFIIPMAILVSQGKEHYKPIPYSDDGVPQPPTVFTHFQYLVGALVYTLFFAVMVVAGLIFLAASQSLLDTLDSFVQAVNWSLLEKFVGYLAIAILVVNLLLLSFMWLQVLEMSRMVQLKYLQLAGEKRSDGESLSWDEHYVPWSPAVVDVLFRACFAILFLSLMLSMICVVMGIAVVGFASAFVQVCNAAFGSMDHVCLNLDFIGIPKVACGDEFQSFCNEWASSETSMILWASFFVFVSHFYVIAATGYAAQQRQSIPAILALYPNPGEEDEPLVKAKETSETEAYPGREEQSAVQTS